MNKEVGDLIMQHLQKTDETFDLIGAMIQGLENRMAYLEDKFIKVLEGLEVKNESN